MLLCEVLVNFVLFKSIRSLVQTMAKLAPFYIPCHRLLSLLSGPLLNNLESLFACLFT